MNINNILESKLFRGVILGIAGLIALGFVFNLGVFVGARRANFSFRWADEYHRNFGGPQGGFFGDFIGTEKEFPNSSGSFGQIIRIDTSANTLTMKDASNVEKNILISKKTTIVYQRKNIGLFDLKINDSIVVIGEPNSTGQIEAVLIRVMPALKIIK